MELRTLISLISQLLASALRSEMYLQYLSAASMYDHKLIDQETYDNITAQSHNSIMMNLEMENR